MFSVMEELVYFVSVYYYFFKIGNIILFTLNIKYLFWDCLLIVKVKKLCDF